MHYEINKQKAFMEKTEKSEFSPKNTNKYMEQWIQKQGMFQTYILNLNFNISQNIS